MTDPQPRQPVFVLVRPQMGENIGAAARAMWNFGLDWMRPVFLVIWAMRLPIALT
jgi:tRNA/rRNA methyltransferase